MVIVFIIGSSVWIYCRCRRHYPERNTYGAIVTRKHARRVNKTGNKHFDKQFNLGDINIKSLEPNSVLKLNMADVPSRTHRIRSIIASHDFKIVKRFGRQFDRYQIIDIIRLFS